MIGKSSNTTKMESEYIMSKLLVLNPTFSRKLKCGDYIILSTKSEPIVVDEDIVTVLSSGVLNSEIYDQEFINTLTETGFIQSIESENFDFSEENVAKKWTTLRKGILIVGFISLISIIVSTFFFGIPIGSKLISKDTNIWVNILFIILFSIVTTSIHEVMHMLFANSWKKTKGGLKLNFKKATATVAMSHIWVWSFLGRITAISAGVIFDLFLLSILTYSQFWLNSWVLPVSCSILWIRILWQLRFHKKSDGQFLISMVIDDPFIEFSSKASNSQNPFLSKIRLIGYFVTFILVFLWFIPFVHSVINIVH
ncbi:lantibiotic ABC transporter permease [Lysinibacillus sp. CTST325]